MRLKDRKAVVTGAASGIGKAIARAFAAEGADVVILDIDEKKAMEVVDDVERVGRRAQYIACDVGYSDAVSKAFDAADSFLGGIDILVNNTGVIRFS